MSHMLKMPTLKHGPPMAVLVGVKSYDSLFQKRSEGC